MFNCQVRLNERAKLRDYQADIDDFFQNNSGGVRLGPILW